MSGVFCSTPIILFPVRKVSLGGRDVDGLAIRYLRARKRAPLDDWLQQPAAKDLVTGPSRSITPVLLALEI